MLGISSHFVLVGGLILTGNVPPDAQSLPPPRQVQPAPPLVVRPAMPHYSYPRVSRYEVWQNVAVDRYGRFRPVVTYTPFGSYYRYNHEPFPWVSTYNWEFTPYIMGPAQPLMRR
jgi:hypothetical protein